MFLHRLDEFGPKEIAYIPQIITYSWILFLCFFYFYKKHEKLNKKVQYTVAYII